MAKVLTEIVVQLRTLAQEIEDGNPTPSTLTAQFGWNTPPLTYRNLAEMALTLAGKLESIPDENVNHKYDSSSLVSQIEVFRSSTLAQLLNSNAKDAAPNYFAMLNYIDSKFSPLSEARINWEKILADGAMPKQIAGKLRSYKSLMKRYDDEFETLDNRITLINQAHDAANELPTDLETLRAANEEVAEKRTAAEKSEILASAAKDKVEALLKEIEQHEKEAKKLVENTEDAYSAATTKGLGEVFQRRAESLSFSMWMWVVLLLLALAIGGVLGHLRLQIIQGLLVENATDARLILNFALAIIALAAPIWFAWIATKQIGHRFRLSEDYAFKASVAQAYEGYRREAARLDENFAKRLFSSTLDRIDEAPIRFVEQETYGSPWHEFIKLRTTRGRSADAPFKTEKDKTTSPISSLSPQQPSTE